MAKLIVAFVAGLFAACVAAFMVAMIENEPGGFDCPDPDPEEPMAELEFNDGTHEYRFRGKLTGYDPAGTAWNPNQYGTFNESRS